GLVVTVLCPERNIDVQTSLARCLAQGDGALAVQDLVNGLGRLDYVVEVDVFGIEIEQKVVRRIKSARAGVQGIDLDAAEVCHVQQRRLVLTKHRTNRFFFRFEHNGSYPVRSGLNVLLEKALAVDAVRMPVKRLGTVLQVR